MPDFDFPTHLSHVRDSFTENFKNDLSWLITLSAIKVRDSLRNWGYIDSDRCASCPRKESIDHCFLNCIRVKPVWNFFIPILTSLLCPSSRFSVNCASVFFFRFPPSPEKNFKLAVFIVKTILYGIWKFRNKATFHNGKENSAAIVKYILQDIKNRVRLDFFRLSSDKFQSVRCHECLCVLINDRVVFRLG